MTSAGGNLLKLFYTYLKRLVVACLAFVFIFASSCASLKGRHSKNQTTKGASPLNASNKVKDTFEDSAEDPNDDDEEDSADDSNVADTEKADETPEEVADVQVSENRSKEEVEADDKAQSTFPLVYNEMVASWIKYFSGRGHSTMARYLGRSTRYIPMMKQVLREEGLPEDLIYLSMIESGFNPKAKSRAKAVGPWQFMKGTGQRYGLKVEYWVDERRDYRKATYAAAQYLKELHQVFGSWYLAAAAYNAGEGKVLSAVRKDRTRNFWELARKKKNFRAETRNYVPKIIAAALVSKNPHKYGFDDVSYEEPLQWETVRVPAGVALKQAAAICGADPEHLEILNSELRRAITPPHTEGYDLRVPPEKVAVLKDNLSNLQSKKIGNFIEYTIQRGDTLSTISRRFGTDIEALRELNQMSAKTKLRPGRELVIPVAGRFASDEDSPRRKRKRHQRTDVPGAATVASPSTSPGTSTVASASTHQATVSAAGGTHVVQSGDTYWSIAKKYGVSMNQLKKANARKGAHSLKPGDTIAVPGQRSGG